MPKLVNFANLNAMDKYRMFSFQLKRISDFLSYHLIKPHRKGHGIHSPFVFDFVNYTIRINNRSALRDIQNLKKQYLKDFSNIEVEDFGAGSKKTKEKIRKISDIVRYSASSERKGNLLYNIVAYYKPQYIIELGTSLGFGTMYMAKACSENTIYTIEGSKKLSDNALSNFNKLKLNNIKAITGNFDFAFPDLLAQIGNFDLLYIDGNHKKDKTLLYFNICLCHAKQGSIVILDDIRWSEGMYEAWLEICANPAVNLTIDLFDLGIVFFNNKIIKQHFRIYY
jgi:predicted O-methyltransferase YrrM